MEVQSVAFQAILWIVKYHTAEKAKSELKHLEKTNKNYDTTRLYFHNTVEMQDTTPLEKKRKVKINTVKKGRKIYKPLKQVE